LDVTAIRDSAPVRLRLLVRAGAEPRALEVEAYADSASREVAQAIGRALGLNGGAPRLYAPRIRAWLEGDTPLADTGLCHGDELIAPTDGGEHVQPEDERAPAELALVGGLTAGRRVPLGAGAHVVGRGAESEIRLADPSLSAAHVELRVSPGGGVEVLDKASSNGTSVDGVELPANEPRPLAPGEIVQAGRTLFEVVPPARAASALSVEPDGSIPFNRPPRVHRPLQPATRPFPPPPSEPYRSRLTMAASLVPLVLGVGLYLVTKLPTMLLFAALSPVMALATFIEDRRSGRRGFARDAREYRLRVAGLRDELALERARELDRRRSAAPAAPELLRRALDREPGLWERRPDDPDFLSLRLGTAEQPAKLTVKLEQGGQEQLRQEVEELAGWYAKIPAPVTAPLAELGVLGLCGPPERVRLAARWLVAQAAALHSPRELAIAAAIAPEQVGEWEWLRWLPHAAADWSPLDVRLTSGRIGARELLEAVAELARLRRREAEGTFGGAAARPAPELLLIVDEAVAPERTLVAEAVGRAAEAGISVLWLGRRRRDLPGECHGIVELDAGPARLDYTDARDGTVFDDVTAEGLELDPAEKLALALAPVRDTSAQKAGGGIPDHVSQLELLGVDVPTAGLLLERWRSHDGGRVALLGASTGGPFTVDLRHDGPHALVAGITGAGKSELLQTLIASLAASYPPTRLTFLLVDYKGGAAFRECVRLPHTVGYVTDLDGHLAQRALASLNAELRRRERLLADAGAKDLTEMEQRDAGHAPPGLAIVIDEFATLVREVPDFVDGVVDVAQRGRSLGVHLVLATQRPSGVVSENIRANTNLRIALRVNEAAESSDVIGSPEAARIPRERPGRAFARTGHGELAEFQTAYVGGTTVARRTSRDVIVRDLAFESARTVVAHAGEGSAEETDLARLVDAARDAAKTEDLPEPVRPWVPPLEPVIALEGLPDPEDDGDPSALAVLGVLDEPALQRRRPLELDLEAEGSLLVYGASGSGKTTLLRTLALSLARRSSPAELHLYALDFATRGLVSLEGLPHCGGVVAGEDEERVARLFSLLRSALERRKLVFAQRGVFTLSEYRRAEPGAGSPPRILVLLDGYGGFSAAFERVNLGELVDALPRLVADGRPLGVHFAITADRRGAVPNALAGIVPAKVVLRMADEDEAAAFGIPLKTIRSAQLPPGRGFLPSGVELQVALPGGDPTGEGQVAALAATAEELRARWPESAVPPVEPLPTRVSRSSLPDPEEPLGTVLGIGDAELEPVAVELAERHFLVCGPYRSGRSTALGTLVESLRRGGGALELHLLAPRRSPLAELDVWASVARGAEECEAAAATIATAVQARSGSEPPLVLVIDDGEELAESLAAPSLETVVRRGRDLGVSVVVAAERLAAQRAFTGWLRELRKDEHGLLLDPDPDVDGEILGARLPRRSNPVFPAGRGYLVDRGAVELVQVAS
jgi:DNA segregation ATPase FtsK/SpoIIIE, S-DNA-T family